MEKLTSLKKVREEMKTHQALDFIQVGIEHKFGGTIIGELALLEIDHIRELYDEGVITYDEISEMITNPDKVKEIAGNT